MAEKFPLNFIQAAFVAENNDPIIEGRDMNELFSTCVVAIERYCDPADAQVLKLRFIDELSLKKCGEAIGVSQERVRQRVTKALRAMRKNEPRNLIRNGAAQFMRNAERESKNNINQLIEDYEKEIAELRDILSRSITPEGDSVVLPARELKPLAQIYDTTLEELNLSVRAYNCLKRADCDHVRDIVKRFKEGNIDRVRNLGKASIKEITYKLLSIGVPAIELDIDDEMLKARQKADEAAAELARVEREKKRKAKEEEQAARTAKEKEAIKYLPEIRDKIINDGVDALGLLFERPILDLLQRNLEKFKVNERCVAILMMTEVINPDDERSPIKSMISDDGLEKFNKQAFGRLRDYSRHTSWERYSYRGIDPDQLSTSSRTEVEALKYIYIRQIPHLSGAVKAVLIGIGMLTIYDIYEGFYDKLPSGLNEAFANPYYHDLLETEGIYDVMGVMKQVNDILSLMGVSPVK